MGFKPPVIDKLTKAQGDVLSRVNSFSSYISKPSLRNLFIPEDQQISSFDFLKKILGAAGASGAIDVGIKKFVDKLFTGDNNLLETLLVGGMAQGMDARRVKLDKSSRNNKEWLEENILPTFQIAKQQLFALIIEQMFQPKKTLPPNSSKEDEDRIVEMVACSSVLYSVSNVGDETVGDLEFKKAELRKQLNKGVFTFEISCKEVVIKMPENFADVIISPGGTQQIAGSTRTGTPGQILERLVSYVKAESIRQNITEDAPAVGKSFIEQFFETLINILYMSTIPQMGPLLTKIESKTQPFKIKKIEGKEVVIGAVSLEDEDLLASPCAIVNSCKDPDTFEKKSSVAKYIINALMAIMLGILLAIAIKKIKELLRNVLAKKATDLAKRLLKKRREEMERRINIVSPGAFAALKISKKASKIATALSKIKPLLEDGLS